MLKVTLRLYRHQYSALLNFLPHPAEVSYRELASLRIEQLVLLDYRARITMQQVVTWQNRPTDKDYALTMPLQVARALWWELQLPIISHGLQGVLATLDKELKDLGFSPIRSTF